MYFGWFLTGKAGMVNFGACIVKFLFSGILFIMHVLLVGKEDYREI